MNIRRQIQLLRVLCAAVVLAACVGVFTTGAWAFNTQTFHTPAETLSLGAFSVSVAGVQPDETGSYYFQEGKHSVTLQAEGNMPSLVLTSWTPEGEAAQQYIVYLDPTCEEDPSIEISVSTYKSMTLTLTPIAEWPEEVEELPEQIVVAAPPAQVEPTDEEPENPQEKTGETENTSTVNIGSGTTTTTSTDESTSENDESQETATVEDNTKVEDETEVESSEDNEVGTQSEVESDGESSLQTPKGESEEPLILESETTSGEPLA